MSSKATLLGSDPKHTGLNAAAYADGFNAAQVEHAHKVARGEAPLSESCSECGEQALFYSRSDDDTVPLIQIEGRCAIICANCAATFVDNNETAGVAASARMQIKRKLKGIAGSR